MLIELTTKNPDGTLLFNGQLTSDELHYILNVGVNVMLQAGHLPFKKLDSSTTLILPEKLQLQ